MNEQEIPRKIFKEDLHGTRRAGLLRLRTEPEDDAFALKALTKRKLASRINMKIGYRIRIHSKISLNIFNRHFDMNI